MFDRSEFLKRFPKASTKNNYLKSFKKFDEFLENHSQTENDFIKNLADSETHTKYNKLQELIYFLEKQVSPLVARHYFDNLFKYFLLNGVPLDYTQKQIRLVFPRIQQRIIDGLDRERIQLILSFASFNFGCYLRTLAGAGLRETEALLLEPQMILYDEYPARVKIPARIAKYNIPRETFLPPKLGLDIQKIISEKKLSPDKTIFTDNYVEDWTLTDFEHKFEAIREKAGLETPGRLKHQKNDISLHSFRGYFITTFTDHGMERHGRAMAGHTKYSNVYFKKSPKARAEDFSKVMQDLDF